MVVGSATTTTVTSYAGSLTKTQAKLIGDTGELSSGKLDFGARTTVALPKTGGILEINWGANLNAVNTGWMIVTYTGPELP